MTKDIKPKQGSKGFRQDELESPESLGETSDADNSKSGGNLARDIGTKDELKRAKERPGGATRVRKGDEQDGSEKTERRNAG